MFPCCRCLSCKRRRCPLSIVTRQRESTVAPKSVRRSVQHTRRRISQCNVRRTMKRSPRRRREGGDCPGVREREVQIDRCARYRGVYVFVGESDVRGCSRRPWSNLPGQSGTDKGRNKRLKHGILWGASLQHAHLPTILYAGLRGKG
jgi:hypothetical protein